MISKISLPHLHVSANCPYPELDQSSLSLQIPLLEDPPRLWLGFSSGLFPSCFPTESLFAPLLAPPPHTCHLSSLSPEYVIYIYRFSTATMVMRTRFNVTSICKLPVFRSANPHKTQQSNLCRLRFIPYRYMLHPRKE